MRKLVSKDTKVVRFSRTNSAKLVTGNYLQGTRMITARIRSTTGRLCFDTCLSVCSQGVSPASWGGVRSSRGGVRSSWGGQVQVGGSGPAGGGQVQPGGVTSSWGGGGSAKKGQHRSTSYMAGSMPLAFTQEDCLVW